MSKPSAAPRILLIDDPARCAALIAGEIDILAAARAQIAAGNDSYQPSVNAAVLARGLMQMLEDAAGTSAPIGFLTRQSIGHYAADAEQLWLHHLDTLDMALCFDTGKI